MTVPKIVKILKNCFDNGGKVLIFGCGGSMAEASHFAAELVGIGYPAIALNDPSCLTAIINDFHSHKIFSKQIKALGKEGDAAIALSTSGKSPSVLYGINKAKKMGLEVIDWPRKGKNTQRIQEYQLKLIHSVYLKLKDENI